MAPLPDLVRPAEGRMVAGVCAGVARKLDVDVQLVRAVVALAAIFGTGGIWIYGLLWLVMPAQGSATAGIDTLIAQAKDWQASQKAQKGQAPQEVFNPYVDDHR